jgi:chitinase
VEVTVTTQGNQWWSNVEIGLKNAAPYALDFQDTTIEFDTPAQVSSVWGEFPSLSYPSNISVSSTQGGDYFKNVVVLSFPNESWANTKLPAGDSVTIKFGLSAGVGPSDLRNIKVFLGNTLPSGGNDGRISLVVPAAPGSDVSNDSPSVDVTGPNGYDTSISLNWQEVRTLDSMAYGDYVVSVNDVRAYRAQPQELNISLGSSQETADVTWQYVKSVEPAAVDIVMPVEPLPGLAGREIYLLDLATQAQRTVLSEWGQITGVSDLISGDSYRVWTQSFNTNGIEYTPNYTEDNPFEFLASASTTTTVRFSYSEKAVYSGFPVNIDITGLPNSSAAVTVTLTGTDGRVYTHDLTSGNHFFDYVAVGQYNLAAGDYESGGMVYRALVTNPYNISDSTSITIQYIDSDSSGNVYAPYVDFTLDVRWDPATGGLVPVDLAKLMAESGVKHFVLAFVVAQSDGSHEPAWGGYAEYSVSQGYGRQTIQDVRALGGDVIISFGGLNGTYLSQACTDVQELVNAYKKVINMYDARHIDFDVEGTQVADTAAMQRMIDALVVIQNEYPNLKIGFTLQVAPKDGLNWAAAAVLKDAVDKDLRFDLVNLMTMDYGGWNTDYQPDKMAQHAMTSAQKTVDYLRTLYPGKADGEIWSLIGLTPMIGVNDVWYYSNVPSATPERFTIGDTDEVVTWSKGKGLKFLSNWSVNRDHSCDSEYANNYCSGAVDGQRMQQYDYEFAEHFLKFEG